MRIFEGNVTILCVCFWLFPELINGGWFLPVEEHGWMCSLTLKKCSQSHAWLHVTPRGETKHSNTGKF